VLGDRVGEVLVRASVPDALLRQQLQRPLDVRELDPDRAADRRVHLAARRTSRGRARTARGRPLAGPGDLLEDLADVDAEPEGLGVVSSLAMGGR
jgi:hypothetical protein